MSGQIERIRIFLDVLDARSFAEAARRRGLSPPAVTRAVAELEAELGTQLLVRTTRKVAPTLAGERYGVDAARIVADLDRADAALKALSDGDGGLLRLAAPLSFGLRFLPQIVAQFRVLWPRTELRLDLSDRFVDIVEGGYDMALRISGPPDDKSSIWRKIASVERVLVAAPALVAEHGPMDHPRDLRALPCLGYANMADGWSLRDPASGASVPVPVRAMTVSDNGDVLARLAEMGQGVALLPCFMVAEALEEGRLVELLPDWKAPEIWLTAFYPPYERLPLPVARLTEVVEGFDWSGLARSP
ncbi:LysR family transcriptional regulator [Roseobacter sp. HKCCA0434]|uniref:LysR family transcriptional regulator n=1 Tax=Roseobacter sp. HKCCA0434 TaxID=3079297 RepID=UPI002905C654|nr:LysR family transcriptional regulator [Roseobacter sp. HKCCA0434]